MGLLQDTIGKIEPISQACYYACEKRWDSIGKPLKSLGKFEILWQRIGAVQGTLHPDIEKRKLIVMCADNGVVARGVTQTGQEVTAIVAENFLEDKTCTSLFCKSQNCDLEVVDIGMAVDTPRTRNLKIKYGTDDFTDGPAMSRQEVIAAIETGIRMAGEAARERYGILLTGEMGIGNTTTSSAVCSVLLDMDPEVVTGRGAGLSTEGLKRKVSAIRLGIERNQPKREDILDVLSKVGGLDIAGLTGVFLGGAANKIPVVIDGFISETAALAAARLCPLCAEYMIPSHISREPAAQRVLEELKLDPLLDAGMCLGEGSGAVMLLPLLDMVGQVFEKMGTFEDISVEAYVPQN